MTAHDALLLALDRVDAPVHLFVRDDDAGWADDALHALLRTMERAAVPIDLAAIPAAVTPALVRELNERRRDGQEIGIHQHGYAHLNHESDGRKCEFGASRSAVAQGSDIRRGAAFLHDAFGTTLDPIFTPPWNRVSPDTPALLAELGFAALSRDSTAAPQQALPELAVHTDWTRQWWRAAEAGADPVQGISADLARHVAPGAKLGLMLHHAVMTPVELEGLAACLAAWRAHPNLRCVPMRALLRQSQPQEHFLSSD